ncbi:MAG: hypothetical protein ACLSWT_05475 [Clostridia bacterium]
MIIISQDKNGILNFDNIQLCRINQEGIVYVFLNEYDSFKLGEYSTEERAKEVLAEIVQKYSSYLQLTGGPAIMQGQMDIQPNIFNIPKVYEMPEN